MIVYKLTAKQRKQLNGQQFAPDSYFSPTEDVNGNWFISKEEIDQNTNQDFEWVKNLPEMEHKPKPAMIKSE